MFLVPHYTSVMRLLVITLLLLPHFAVIQTPSNEVVRKAVQDEFGGLFALNAQRRNQNIHPAFVTGDFDGDGRTDLAVLVSVRPEEVQRRLAADPRFSIPALTITKALGKGVSASEAKNARLSFEEVAQDFRESLLLLILQDFGRSGRPAPRFALLDFSNNGDITMTISRKPLKRAPAGDSPVTPPPRLKGDALLFLDARGEGTAVYWDGARYLWYPIE
ncbi:MAG: hypothetical protein DMG14_17705 [Acidobacteria bacterium]|nr:MAG: hypothetical protein DMG14_17705 [Acidobacteriota bacterium]